MKKIILLSLLSLFTIVGSAQLTVELGANKTDLNKNAFTFAVSYFRSLDSLFGGEEMFVPGKRSFLLVTPEIDIRTGTEDAYSSIVLKAAGIWNVFQTKKSSGGLIVPDFGKTVHSFPVSIGLETNNQFNNTNGILEVGWVPFYQSYTRSSPAWIKHTKFGVFLQTGYKFNGDTTGAGGQHYEGEEQVKDAIFRGRGLFSVDTKTILRAGNINVGLVGSVEGWADIVNSAFYHKVEGRARLHISDSQYIDFIISSGSGAPLFNQAKQYGVGTTIKL